LKQLAYQDGGGAFLIPFIIMSLVIGIPMVFLEMSVGQYMSTSTVSCWRMCQCFRGIGFAMNFSNIYVVMYYNMVIAYAFYYLFMSFTTELPWVKCNPSWASPSNFQIFIFKKIV
jgi:solute carrier family 6 amino acid transporter-like protein 5/7/9/14